MKILITGANGQLGITLQDVLKDHQLILTDREELDITNANAVNSFVGEKKPDVIINAAAYTAVDKAEEEIDTATKINVDGAKNLAIAAKKINALFLHISTDFVFDGEKKIPYIESDLPCPLSVYGQTKFDAEKAVEKINRQYFILRTAWLYSPFGKNFVKTMIKLGQEKDEIKVVSDQIGCPTYAYDLADAIRKLIEKANSYQLTAKSYYGLYHFAGSGSCSWYEFASEIIKLSGGKAKVLPITTAEFDAIAPRPAYSVLDCSKIKSLGIKTIPWQESLKRCIDILKKN